MKQRNFFQGLQGKLLTFFLLMSLVPLITVSAISYQRAKASLTAMAHEMLDDTANGIMRTIDVLMNDRQDDKAWAALPIMADSLQKKEYVEASRFLASMVKEYDVYKLIMLFDTGGNLVAASDPKFLNSVDVEKNQAGHEWFKQAVKGSIHVQDRIFQRPSMTMCSLFRLR